MQELIILAAMGGLMLAAVVVANRSGIRVRDTRDRRETDC